MKYRIYAGLILALWAVVTAVAWFAPGKELSDAERRLLAQMPQISADTLLDGTFAADFESYTLDQFPLRDRFRQMKALFHYYVLGQKDNNGIYIENGYAAQQVYLLDQGSLDHALDRFRWIRETYLADSQVYMAVVPDKNYYLADAAGQPSLDYAGLLSQVEQAMPWATHIDLTEELSIGDYYRTDTHWRQEKLLPVAQKIATALKTRVPQGADFTQTALERPFYGVYYGQAALPMAPETITLLESDQLAQCSVYDYETGKTGPVYDRSKLDSKDLYDVYLSGARALLTIENPSGNPEKELLIFRDSFGSSLAPLLVGDYGKVTLIDLRYIRGDILEQFLTFQGQDALFLYSTLVLNSSSAIK